MCGANGHRCKLLQLKSGGILIACCKRWQAPWYRIPPQKLYLAHVCDISLNVLVRGLCVKHSNRACYAMLGFGLSTATVQLWCIADMVSLGCFTSHALPALTCTAKRQRFSTAIFNRCHVTCCLGGAYGGPESHTPHSGYHCK